MATEREAITQSIDWPWYAKLGRCIQLLEAMLFSGFVSSSINFLICFFSSVSS